MDFHFQNKTHSLFVSNSTQQRFQPRFHPSTIFRGAARFSAAMKGSEDESEDGIGTFAGESVYQALVCSDAPRLAPGQDWEWRRAIFLEQPVKFSLYNRKLNIAKLMDKVKSNKELSTAFSGCCFGSYLNMDNTGASCARAFSFLMSREIVCRGATEDELWFRVGGFNIRFGPDDFALAIGLKYGTPEYNISAHRAPPARGIKQRLFGNRRPNMREVLDRFVADNWGRVRVDLGDKLKLAKILFLYLQLLGSDSQRNATFVENFMKILTPNINIHN